MLNKEIFERCFMFSGFRWYKNIKYIPRYFREMHFLIKNGYDKYAAWSINTWFMDTMKNILKRYREHHLSYPIVIDNYPFYSSNNSKEDKQLRENNNRKWDGIIDSMINLLDDMDEFNPKYEGCDYFKSSEMQTEAKNKFFELFSQYFYCLWD